MTQQEFNNRRQALLAKMAPASAAVIFSAPETTRSADSDYPYRQNSDFWYLTGFNEPEAVLVLIKSDETHNHSVLFNRVRDLTAEIWFGRRLGKTPRRRSWAWIARCRSMKSMTSCTCCSTAWTWSTTRRANTRMPIRSCSARWTSCARGSARICRRRPP